MTSSPRPESSLERWKSLSNYHDELRTDCEVRTNCEMRTTCRLPIEPENEELLNQL